MSTTDPDSTYATKGGTPARLGYYDNYLVDNHSCVIVGVQATAARMSQETVAAQDMLTRFAQWQGRAPDSVAADTTYGNGEFLQWLADRSITPYMRTRDSILRLQTCSTRKSGELPGSRSQGGTSSPRTTAPYGLTVSASLLSAMGATTTEVPSSHVVMLSQPQVVIDVIRKAIRAAQGVSAAA